MLLDEKDEIVQHKFIRDPENTRWNNVFGKINARKPVLKPKQPNIGENKPVGTAIMAMNKENNDDVGITGISKPVDKPTVTATEITNDTTIKPTKHMRSRTTPPLVILTKLSKEHGTSPRKPNVPSEGSNENGVVAGESNPTIIPVTQVFNYSDVKALNQPTKQPGNIVSIQHAQDSTIPTAMSTNQQRPDAEYNAVSFIPDSTAKPSLSSANKLKHGYSPKKKAKPSTHVGNKETQADLSNNDLTQPRPAHPTLDSIKPSVAGSQNDPYNHEWKKRVMNQEINKNVDHKTVTPFGRKLWISGVIPFEISHNGTNRFPVGNYTLLLFQE